MWYVYILRCENEAFYVGITDNIQKRFQKHVSGNGANFTKRNHPVEILYRERFNFKTVAQKRENQIKRWSRAKKLALIEGDKNQLKKLSVSHD